MYCPIRFRCLAFLAEKKFLTSGREESPPGKILINVVSTHSGGLNRRINWW